MFTNSLIAFATETAATTAAGMDTKASTISMLFSFGLLIIVFYFFLIRPQKKKEKEAKQLRDNLQIGDEVTTIGGIVGIIVRKTEDTCVIETGGDRSKIRVKLWAIPRTTLFTMLPKKLSRNPSSLRRKRRTRKLKRLKSPIRLNNYEYDLRLAHIFYK